MNILSESFTRALGKTSLVFKKNSPHILFGAGVIGVIGAGVMACKATLRAEETLDKIKVDVDSIREMKRTSEEMNTPYADQAYYKDLAYVSKRALVDVGKLYGPSIVVGVVSIGCLTTSHRQLTQRNAALTFTLAAVSKAYSEYRVRVQEVVGKERELDIYQNLHEVEMISEDGRTSVEKVRNPSLLSPYARCFDEFSSSEWEQNATLNRMFVVGTMNQFNTRLRSHGHVFLNEIYDQLGFSRTPEGQIVGWIWRGDGDNFIDFGLDTPQARDFVDGIERTVWLDFNVDGPVFEKI